MAHRILRSLLVAASFLSPLAVGAQNVPPTRPTTAEAQALLQNRPDLLAQLRQRFATSGLTKDQVHARLKAEGYPEDLLDAYLPGFTGQPTTPGDDVFRAVRALGVVSDSEMVSLQALRAPAPQPQQMLAGPGSASKDTIERSARPDSVAFSIFGL